MNELGERINSFIGFLQSLAQEGRENRGALAELRSGLGEKPGEAHKMHRHIVRYLSDKSSFKEDRLFYLIASLYASYPETAKESKSLGKCFGDLREGKQINDSTEKRFIALLSAHPDDLPDLLRQSVSLLKARQTPLDWKRLFWDLKEWDNPEKTVQQRWARDFYHEKGENKNEN